MSECKIWDGMIDAKGYGYLKVYAHRKAWEDANGGPVPDGFHVDHLCRNHACINPEHLEPVTPKENILRGVGVAAINARKKTCKLGHAFDMVEQGRRRCRKCYNVLAKNAARRERLRNRDGVNARQRAWYLKNRDKVNAKRRTMRAAVLASLVVLLVLAKNVVAQDYTIQMIPVGFPGFPAPMGKTTALAICQNAAAEWLTISKGKVRITCVADDPHVLSSFPGCRGDWTNAIADGHGSIYPFYVHSLSQCGAYEANLGRPGGWLNGGGQLTHEFGHCQGLNHTASVVCRNSPFDPEPTGPCEFHGYALAYDVMGSGVGLNAFHAMRLGVPPQAVSLTNVTGTQAIGLSVPVHFPRTQGIEYWVEYLATTDQVVVDYSGYLPFGQVDVMNVANLANGQTWQDPAGGITINRVGQSIQLVVVTPPVPTATPPPVPTQTPPPDNRCFFGFYQISCTATPVPTREATWTPTAAANATLTTTPTTQGTPVPSSTATLGPGTPGSGSPTSTPTGLPGPPSTSPTRPPPSGGGACGGGQAGMAFYLQLVLGLLLLRLLKSRR